MPEPITNETTEEVVPQETPTTENNETVVETQDTPNTGDASDDLDSRVSVDDGTYTGVGFDDFLRRRQGEEVKPTEEKPEEKTTPEENKDETPATTVETPVTPGKKPVVLQKDRDFTEIDEADRPLFRDMSKTSFEKLKEVYVANKKAAAKIAELEQKVSAPQTPKAFYEHPQAYTLDESYQQAAKGLEIANGVESHIITQLENIAKGDKWQDLGVDPKTGEIYVQSDAKEPNVRAEVYLKGLLTQAQNEKHSLSRKISEVREGFTKTYQSDIQVIKAAEEKYFPGYDKEDHPTRKTQQGFLELLPVSHRNHPLASVLAKTVANNGLFIQKLEAANKELAELKAKFAAVKPVNKNIQPTKSHLSPNGNNGKKSIADVSYEDYQRRLQGVV